MFARLEMAFVAMLLLLAAVTATAWVHSSAVGYERTWADPDNVACGRFASARGRLLWQRCDLKPTREGGPNPPRLEVRVPDDLVVGTNPSGKRTRVECGPHSVPFAFPEDGLFFSLHGVGAATGSEAGTISGYVWEERSIAYWLILAVLLLILVAAGIDWLLRRRRRYRASSPPAEVLAKGNVAGSTVVAEPAAAPDRRA